MMKPKILSTKSLAPSVLAKAKREGIDIVEQDAIKVKPVLTKEKWDEIFSLVKKNTGYAVFTSSNAVDAIKKYLHAYINPLPVQWKIFCLSGKTKDAVEASADCLGTIEATAPNAVELAKKMVAKGLKEVLFFCGNRRRDELPVILQTNGVQVHEAVVYETIATPVRVEEDVDAVLFFSPSAVQSFFSVNQLKKEAVCFAIGATTADCLKKVTPNKIIVSKSPSQEGLLNEVINYFRNW